MAKLFFYIGVWLASLLFTGSEEKSDAPENELQIQSSCIELVTIEIVSILLDDSILDLYKL